MTPPCVVPTFRPYTVENLEFGGFYASTCESRANMMAGGETQSIGRGDLRSNGLECAYFPQLRLGQTVFIRNLRDFADDPEDFGSCVDPIELLSH